MLGDSKIKYIIVSPSGNDTALVYSSPNRDIAKQILDIEKNVEQIMFVLHPNSLDNKTPYYKGIMAGGEMCVNATRALGYHLLDGRDGEITIDVSGIEGLVKVCVEASKSYVSFNLSKFLISVDNLESGIYKVVCSGITHIIIREGSRLYRKEPDKEYALSILEKYDLKNELASGVMFLTNENTLLPFVYVMEINTLYYETACGSGSIASSVVLKKFVHKDLYSFEIKQPSGYSLSVSFEDDERVIGISGIVKILDTKYTEVH